MRPRLNAHGWLKGDIIRRLPGMEVELLDDGAYQSGISWGFWVFQARVLGTGATVEVIPLTTDENLTMTEAEKK